MSYPRSGLGGATGRWGLGQSPVASAIGGLIPPYPQAQFPASPPPYSEATYLALRAGTTRGGQYTDFADAAQRGWFTDDYAGYTNFLAWWGAGIEPKIAAGLWEYIGWQTAGYGIDPVTAAQNFQSMVKWSGVSVAHAQQMWAAYNAERSRRGLSTGGGVLDASNAVFNDGTPMRAPVALTIQSTLYDFVLKSTAQGGLYQEEAETQTNTMSDGTIQTFPWIPNSQWTTPADLQARYTIASIPRGQGNPPASSTVRVRFWPDLSQGEQDKIQADLLIARGGKVLYDAPGSGGFEQPGVTWTDLIAAPVPLTYPSETPWPQNVPFSALPPGSTVALPPPGSGLPPTVKLPGTTAFVPVATLPASALVPLAERSDTPVPGAAPVVVVQTVHPTVPGGGTGGGGTVLVDGSGQIVNPDGTAPTPLTAGGISPLLLAGLAAIAFFVLPGTLVGRSRSRRR